MSVSAAHSLRFCGGRLHDLSGVLASYGCNNAQDSAVDCCHCPMCCRTLTQHQCYRSTRPFTYGNILSVFSTRHVYNVFQESHLLLHPCGFAQKMCQKQAENTPVPLNGGLVHVGPWRISTVEGESYTCQVGTRLPQTPEFEENARRLPWTSTKSSKR